MNPMTHSAAGQYTKISAQGNVAAANPHRLIQLMMQRALDKIAAAKGHMARAELARKGVAIGDSIEIINGLQASLNHKADKRLSENFDALYAYMMRRLLEANLRDEAPILDEVTHLLAELKEAWDAIADQANDMAAMPAEAASE